MLDGQTFTEAALSEGYAKTYIDNRAITTIKNNDRFCAYIAKRKAQRVARSELTVQKVQENAMKCMAACVDEKGHIQDKASYLKANEQLGRTITAFSDKHITEDSEEVRELRSTVKDEARRLATIRLADVS